MTRAAFIAGLLLAFSGCATHGDDDGHGRAPAFASSEQALETAGTPGALGHRLYTLTNDRAANQVASYLRAPDGRLRRAASFNTGGKGDPAIAAVSQGSLVFGGGLQRFFAVNAGDNTLSMLAADRGGALAKLSTVASGGEAPVSVAVYDDMVYVLNQGALDGSPQGANISGFRVAGDKLVPIAGSTRPLSVAGNAGAADIAFTPDGRFLIVAEVFTSKLDTFEITGGVAQPGKFQTSAGDLPFAFDFSPDGFLVVSEIGNPDIPAHASTVSSYTVSNTGALLPITSALPIFQDAACWIVVAGGVAYVANFGSGTISGVKVSRHGELARLDDDGVTATTGAGASDLALSPDHRYLYSLAAISHTISLFALGANGSLAPRGGSSDVPDGATGLVAR